MFLKSGNGFSEKIMLQCGGSGVGSTLGTQPSEKFGTDTYLRRQRRSLGKQGVGIGIGLPTLERAGDQADVEQRGACFAEKGHGFVVRASAACHPAEAKSARIEERPQVRFTILRRERFRGREASTKSVQLRKWRTPNSAEPLPARVAPAARAPAPSARPRDRGNRYGPAAEIGQH